MPEHEGKQKILIGEDVSERLDVTPAKFRVIVTRRPKYAFKNEDGVIQALGTGASSSRAAFLPKRLWPRSLSQNMPMACRSIGKRPSMPVTRWSSIAQLMAQWMGKLGFELEPLAGYYSRPDQAGRQDFCRRDDAANIGAWIRPAQKQPICGLTPEMTGRSAAMARLWSPIALRTADPATALPGISTAIEVFFKSMGMLPITGSPDPIAAMMPLCWQGAGAHSPAENSMNCTSMTAQGSQPRPSSG